MDLITAMTKRQSARVYTDKPVTRAQVEKILDCARLAPSAINLQPWEYVVTYGEEKDRLIRRLKKVHSERSVPCGPGTATPLSEKYTQRSRHASQGLKPHLEAAGIPFNRFIEDGSCSFYGAPIAIIVTMDKIFPPLRYLDVGLSVSYLLLAAQAEGLATCPIGLITAYGDDIAEVLSIPKEKEILLAIALGHADEASALNQFKTPREPIEVIRTWYE